MKVGAKWTFKISKFTSVLGQTGAQTLNSNLSHVFEQNMGLVSIGKLCRILLPTFDIIEALPNSSILVPEIATHGSLKHWSNWVTKIHFLYFIFPPHRVPPVSLYITHRLEIWSPVLGAGPTGQLHFLFPFSLPHPHARGGQAAMAAGLLLAMAPPLPSTPLSSSLLCCCHTTPGVAPSLPLLHSMAVPPPQIPASNHGCSASWPPVPLS